ncbi:MAG: RluA family pseudouridine synthase [Kiritimatiellales bacterium]
MFQRTVETNAKRLDVWLAEQQPEHSRARWQSLIKARLVTVNGAPAKANQKLHAGDKISWMIPPAVDIELRAEDIPLDILYEDNAIIAVNKPAGLVVHPAAGNETGTLVNALLHHCENLASIAGEKRPGIIHRLDKDTSGVIVAAKTEAAMNSLAEQFKQRETEKEYLTIVKGVPAPPHGVIQAVIGRHPIHRKKMAVNVRNGRGALSRYEIVEKFPAAAMLSVKIETGRTHQIRVHMAHIKHPVLGDKLYGRSFYLKAPRQMLHAAKLSIIHPVAGNRMMFTAPLPDDMQLFLQMLRTDRQEIMEALKVPL